MSVLYTACSMRSTHFSSIVASVAMLALSACTGANTLSAKYPFPTTLPSGQVLDEKYQRLNHDLSPIADYHFRIQIPNGWKTLDAKITQEPQKNSGPSDVAIFREPGDWMTNPTGAIRGEVSVSAVNVAGIKDSPSDWLLHTLQKNAKGFTLVQKRESPSAAGPVSDVLITYLNDDQLLVSRMMAFRSGDRMFVITCSDAADGYAKNAQAFNVAISTFRLDSAGKNVTQ